MGKMNYTVKDSVFTYLFSQPEYTRQLYLTLHPEDTDVTEEDCKLVTLENILTTGLYNDLGIQIRNRLILLVEAQSTFCINIVLRILLYLANTYKDYVDEHKLNLYSTKPVKIPCPELYVVYTGNKKDAPDELHLSDLFDGKGSVELTVRVLKRNNQNDIIDQYVRFCEIANEQRKEHGRTEEAVSETIEQCMEEGVLAPFLSSRKKEIESIMMTVFSQDKAMEMWGMELFQQGEEVGIAKGIDKGIAQEQEEGITALISSLYEFNIGKDKIAEKLIEKYHLSAPEANKKIEQYMISR